MVTASGVFVAVPNTKNQLGNQGTGFPNNGGIDGFSISRNVVSDSYSLMLFNNEDNPVTWGTSSAWVDSGGGGVSLSVTEVLQPFSDSSLATIAPKVSISVTVTEALSAFTDNSTVTIVEAGNVSVSVTETLSPFAESSIIKVSANVELLVTEVLNSFLDGSNVTIAKDITVTVTEVLNSFADNSTVRMPADWNDKPQAVTSYTIKPPVSTIWINKG